MKKVGKRKQARKGLSAARRSEGERSLPTERPVGGAGVGGGTACPRVAGEEKEERVEGEGNKRAAG